MSDSEARGPQSGDTASPTHPSPDIIPIEQLSYALGAPSESAVLKQEFSDFCVDEQLGFTLTNNGDHLYLQVQKTDISTPDVARRLAEVGRVEVSQIGYSGMKDRRGVCSQWFSMPADAQLEAGVSALETPTLKILDTARNSRKLKIGSHKSNEFRILLRNCSGEQAEFNRRLDAVREQGVPNYFGAQRFGRNMTNIHQALELMANTLSSSGGSKPKRLPRFKRGMLFSAARSYLFNQLLSRRLEAGNWCDYLEGDVLNLAGTSRCFVLKEGESWDETLQQRLSSFDIHISGPLAGVIDSKDKYVSSGEAADIEDAVLKQFPILLNGLKSFEVQAGRRPLRFMPSELSWQWRGERDLELSFGLSSGSYATSLLRELCNTH